MTLDRENRENYITLIIFEGLQKSSFLESHEISDNNDIVVFFIDEGEFLDGDHIIFFILCVDVIKVLDGNNTVVEIGNVFKVFNCNNFNIVVIVLLSDVIKVLNGSNTVVEIGNIFKILNANDTFVLLSDVSKVLDGFAGAAWDSALIAVAGGNACLVIWVATADVLNLIKNISKSGINSFSLGKDIRNKNLEGLNIILIRSRLERDSVGGSGDSENGSSEFHGIFCFVDFEFTLG